MVRLWLWNQILSLLHSCGFGTRHMISDAQLGTGDDLRNRTEIRKNKRNKKQNKSGKKR